MRVLILAGLVCMLPQCISHFFLYPRPQYAVPSPPPAPFREVDLRLPGGEAISAWSWIRSEEQGPLMLYFHGNGENLGTMLDGGQLGQFVRHEIEFLAVDFPGYGRSEGWPSEDSVRAAGRAGVQYLRQTYPRRPLVIAGWSLGAAAAMQTVAASPGDYQGLALFSPWTSLREIGAVHFGWAGRSLAGSQYDSRRVARAVRAPVLLIHGRNDTIIPFEQGRALAGEFPDPDRVRFVPLVGTGHNDLFDHPEVWLELRSYLPALASR